jgi:hypothetical protein
VKNTYILQIPFFRERVEPCTRGISYQNLDQIHGLGVVYSNDPARKISLMHGGNNQLVKSMLTRSNATVKTASQVAQITHGVHRRYRILLAPGHDTSQEPSEFDVVLLAAFPDSLAAMLSEIVPPKNLPVPPKYTEAHVTHFATETLLHLPGVEPNSNVPISTSDVYFTNRAKSTRDDFPDLLHASTSFAMERYPNCDELECDEFNYFRVHRVVSRSELSDADIARITGTTLGAGETLEGKGIRHTIRAAWSVPLHDKGRGVPDNIELAPGLYYLAGGDQLVSSLEMGCRMGRNGAKLVARGGGIQEAVADGFKEVVREDL